MRGRRSILEIVMLLAVLVLCLGSVSAKNITEEEDLQIIGSDNHFSYQPSFRSYDFPQEAGFYQVKPENFDSKNAAEEKDSAADMNYPVKTVQRFKDQDGNVRVVTSYSNRDDNPLPIYKNNGLPLVRPLQKPSVQEKAEIIAPRKNIYKNKAPAKFSDSPPKYPEKLESRHNPRAEYSEAYVEPRPKKLEYSATKTIKFPNNDGGLFANQHETSVQDGSASSYNHQSSYNSKSKKPTIRRSKSEVTVPADSVGKVVNQPLQEAGSSYVSDVDDGFVDDGGYDGGGGGAEYSSYSGGGDYGGGGGGSYHHGGGGGGGGGGHGGGGHGGGFENEKGKSFAKDHQESKGDKGGKGHKSHESYEKGHSENHGHEENKGGRKEESGEKTGHLDEANNYSKGHHSNSGGKAHEKGHTKGHKKGHKTKGFRTVHHKDEYKKDEVFYDEEHDAGHQKGHGHDQSSHKQVKGGNDKKGHLNSGYKDAHKGFQGDKEEGHSFENSKGHNGNAGHKSHHGHHSSYGKASGHSEGESHGHAGKGHY